MLTRSTILTFIAAEMEVRIIGLLCDNWGWRNAMKGIKVRFLLLLLICLLLIVFLTGCGGGSTSTPPPVNPDFQFSATPLSPSTVTVGGTTSSVVSSTAVSGFNGTVTLACSGLPSGAQCSFNPATVEGSGTSLLTVSTSTST